VGHFYRTWGLLAGAVAAVTVILVGLTVSSLVSAYSVGQQTGMLRKRIAELDRQKQAAQQVLDRPENRETRDRSRFLNELIARKAFSWTEVFADLEKIVPSRVQVMSIAPDITEDNQIQVSMRIQADSREKSVELIRRLEASKTFRHPQVKSETSHQAAGGSRGGVQFDIVALYTPKVPAIAAPKTGAQGGTH